MAETHGKTRYHISTLRILSECFDVLARKSVLVLCKELFPW
jgi:hypothetical protein